MNAHAHRLIFDRCRGMVVAVAECACSAGKSGVGERRSATRRSAIFALGLLTAAGVMAQVLPSGGVVVRGAGTIQVDGKSMLVNQSTARMVTDWTSFSIGSDASVRFVQPSTSSVALNRVLGDQPSAIFGSLSANGHVYLQNPSGVLFAPGAQVNVGSLVATTLAGRPLAVHGRPPAPVQRRRGLGRRRQRGPHHRVAGRPCGAGRAARGQSRQHRGPCGHDRLGRRPGRDRGRHRRRSARHPRAGGGNRRQPAQQRPACCRWRCGQPASGRGRRGAPHRDAGRRFGARPSCRKSGRPDLPFGRRQWRGQRHRHARRRRAQQASAAAASRCWGSRLCWRARRAWMPRATPAAARCWWAAISAARVPKPMRKTPSSAAASPSMPVRATLATAARWWSGRTWRRRSRARSRPPAAPARAMAARSRSRANNGSTSTAT